MTEEEAKKKWCPFARVTMYLRGNMSDLERPLDVVGHACNRMLTDDPTLTTTIQTVINESGGTKCLGSACMAWRVHYAENDGNGTEHGYCGLAGKP